MRISDWSSDVCSSYLGKPGTTNDETDACFNGFQATQVAIAWVGFDQPAPLGAGEVGARAALPIWIDYMRVALAGVPQARLPRPAGLVDVRVDPRTGTLASAGTPGAVFEIVQQDHVPEAETDATQDRKSVVEGKSVAVRGDLGGRRIIKKKTK